VLRVSTRFGQVTAIAVSLALATSVLAVLASTPAAAAPARAMAVAPSLGLAGAQVRFSGADVPKHVSFSVLFDLTTKDKVLLCTGATGTHTTWRCVGTIPAQFGGLGEHTVEMDATTASGTGDFLELSTFLVTDLGVLMTAPPTSAPGGAVALRVTVSNGGATVARGIVVTDQLPAGLRFERATSPCKATTRGLVRCGPFRMSRRSRRAFQLSTLVVAANGARLVDVVSIKGTPDPLRRNDRVRVLIKVT
jgi:uncharacterized repeat protein (TIGR01451 family)